MSKDYEIQIPEVKGPQSQVTIPPIEGLFCDNRELPPPRGKERFHKEPIEEKPFIPEKPHTPIEDTKRREAWKKQAQQERPQPKPPSKQREEKWSDVL